MDAHGDRAVLTQAVDASVAFRSGGWGVAGFALLLLLGALFVLLGWIADGADVRERFDDLSGRPTALAWFVVIVVLVARALFAVAGSRIMQESAARITGVSRDAGEWRRSLRQLVADFWDTPLDVLWLPFLLGVVLAVLLQIARIPYAGKVFFFLLLPVVVYLAFGIVRPVVRWLLSGHLIGAAIATEPTATFPAQSTAFAFLARDGLRVLGLRVGTFACAIGTVLLRGAAVAFLWLAIRLLAPEVLAGRFGDVLAAIAVWWLASLLVAACYAGRVAQYVVLRRALDGVPLEGASHIEAPASLEQMGVELVERLGRREEE